MSMWMKLKSGRWAVWTALAGSVVLSGCIVAPVDQGYAYTTYGSPPPVRYEAVPVAPSAAYVWTPGIWVWGGARYDWRPGYWAPRGGHGPYHRGPGWRHR